MYNLAEADTVVFTDIGDFSKNKYNMPMVGPYDKLYASREILWSETPGRMVKKALNYLKPGKALDLGCGDCNNLLFLEKNGWVVDGIDISSLALKGAERRFLKHKFIPKKELILNDVVVHEFEQNYYDLVIAYGIYHCLNDAELKITHDKVMQSLKPGGLIAFATFNDILPMPEGHQTDDLILRKPEHIFEFVGNTLEVLDKEIGIISQDHLPIIGEHKHSLTWALFRKP